MSMNHPSSYSSSYPQRLRECDLRHGPWPCIILNLVHPRPSLSSLAATNHSLNLTSLLSSLPSSNISPSLTPLLSLLPSPLPPPTSPPPHLTVPNLFPPQRHLHYHPPLPQLSILTLSSTFLSIPQSADLVWTIITSGALRSIEAYSDRAE